MYTYHPQKTLLLDKVLLVTGAGDGIGREAAIAFAQHGASVILLGRTVSKLEATYDAITQLNCPEPAIVPMDLKGASAVHYTGLAETIENQYGRLDGVLHNAASLGLLGSLEHTPKATFDEVIQVNVTAQFQLTQSLLPLLKQSPSATILFTSVR